MQTQEIPRNDAATVEKNNCPENEQESVVTTDSLSSSSSSSSKRPFRLSKYGDVKIYDLLKAREGSTMQKFPQILFVGDARFSVRSKFIRHKYAVDMKVYEKSGLTLESIKSFLIAQADIDFAKQTLLICSVGAFDVLPTDEIEHDRMLDLVQRGKDVKTTLCKLFSESCIVLFLPILPVDFTRKLCNQPNAQCTDNKRKGFLNWVFQQINEFNEVLYSSSPNVIFDIMHSLNLYSFKSFIDFTQNNTDDGIQLNANTSLYLSKRVGDCVFYSKQRRYENVIFVGDMRLEDFVKASPNWQDSSCVIKVLCAFNHKLSKMDENGSVLRELATLKNSLVVFILGVSDLYEIYSSVCQGCGRNVKFPVVKTFAMPLSDLVSQIYFDLCKAESLLRTATKDSCEVMFSMAYPLDIISCQDYYINEHLKICNNMNIVKPLSSSPIAVEKMTEDSSRLIEILNKVRIVHSTRNEIVSWDPLTMIYGDNYTMRSSSKSKVADVFRDGVHFTSNKFQSVTEQMFTNVQLLNLFSGHRRIKWMAVNHVVTLNDLILDCYSQGLHSNSVNINFSKKISSPNGIVPMNIPLSTRKPLLPTPYSSCSTMNWMPSTVYYNPGAQYMQYSHGAQCVNAYSSLPSNPYLVFQGGRFYCKRVPADGYSTQQSYKSFPACHYSSNLDVQNSQQQYMYGFVVGGLQQNKTGSISGAESQSSGSIYANEKPRHTIPENNQNQTHTSTNTLGVPGQVNSDPVLPCVQHEARSSPSSTLKTPLASKIKVCDESDATLGTLQQQDSESYNTLSKKDDKTTSGTPHTQNAPQLSLPKGFVRMHDKSLHESRKGDAGNEAQPLEVIVEEKAEETSHQEADEGIPVEACESEVKNFRQMTDEGQVLMPESKILDVTGKSSLNFDSNTLLFELGKKNGKSQSYLSILKQNNINSSSPKFHQKDEKSVSSLEKSKEKENKDIDEHKEITDKRNSGISGLKSDTEKLSFRQKEHSSMSYDSDNPPNYRHAKQPKLCDGELSPLSSNRDGGAVSAPKLLNKCKKNDERCFPQLEKQLKRKHEVECDEQGGKRLNKGTADVSQKTYSEFSQHCSFEEELDAYKRSVLNYLMKLNANEEPMSIDNVTSLDDYATLSTIALETKDHYSNLGFNSTESNLVKITSFKEVCQMPSVKANKIIDILEALRNFGDDLGTLKAPLIIMYEKTLQLQAVNLDVSRILINPDNLTILSSVLQKLEQINNSPDQSIVQKIILEEVSERLGVLLKNIS